MMHHGIGIFALVAAVAFAFGARAAQACVAVALIAGMLAIGYVAVLVVTGTI